MLNSPNPTSFEIASRFACWPSFLFYAWGKLAWDPAFAAVEQSLRESRLPLLDMGCGLGLLSFYLRERGHDVPMLGIDVSRNKIRAANIVAERWYRDIAFAVGDVRTPPTFQGNVAMLDVIHYFPAETQRRILESMADRVAPGGRVVMRCTLRENNWRYYITCAEEILTRISGWIPVRGFHFPSREEILRPFQERGFRISHRPLWGRTPFNSHYFEFERG